MTPRDIFEYKQRWTRDNGGYSVRLHSDIRSRGTEFCKTHLMKHQWDFKIYSGAYEDTFLFEHKHHAEEFKKQWPEFVDQ